MVLDIQTLPQEQWQDFVHELAHVLKYAENPFNMNRMTRELQEYQANSFMYHFCVPTFMLEKMSLPRMQSEAIKLIGDTLTSHTLSQFERYKRKLFSEKLYLVGC
jgi:Zn-dependent peptidase ImmA (M78 family)